MGENLQKLYFSIEWILVGWVSHCLYMSLSYGRLAAFDLGSFRVKGPIVADYLIYVYNRDYRKECRVPSIIEQSVQCNVFPLQLLA